MNTVQGPKKELVKEHFCSTDMLEQKEISDMALLLNICRRKSCLVCGSAWKLPSYLSSDMFLHKYQVCMRYMFKVIIDL